MARLYPWCSFQILWIYCSLAVAGHPLSGKNIRVMVLPTKTFMDIERNATGHIISLSGMFYSVMESLAEHLNFTFDVNHTTLYSLSDSPLAKGGLYYLIRKEVDLMLGTIIMVPTRLEFMDFPYAFTVHFLDLVMPMPARTVHGIAAVWKPLEHAVWWVFIVSVIFMLTLFWFVLKKSPLYVFEVLLSQGRFFRCQTLNYYLLAGSWGLGCFILVTAYSSVLISFITAPIYQPLVNSIYDLISRKDVYPVFESGRAVDILLRESTEHELSKQLLSRADGYANLRCNIPEDCLNKVRSGNRVFIQTELAAMDLIGRELKRTGRCDFSLKKDRFIRFLSSIALAKDSPYTDTISIGLIRMEAAGLFDFWWRRVTMDPTFCLDEARARPINPRLDLNELAGAFLVLGLGGILSTLAYLSELVLLPRLVIPKRT